MSLPSLGSLLRSTDSAINISKSLSSSQFDDNLGSPNATTFVAPMTLTGVVYGLRPSTTVYVFIDNIPVSNLCTPCNNSITTVATPIAAEGGTLTTSSSGVLVFSLRIPKNTISAKTCLIRIADVSDLTQIDTATTKAICTFYGSGITTDITTDTSGQVSTPTSLNFTEIQDLSTVSLSQPNSLPAGVDPYYYTVSKVLQNKRNTATIYIGGYGIGE